jgi:hypothetical protein
MVNPRLMLGDVRSMPVVSLTSSGPLRRQNNKGRLYQCRASPFGRHARAGFSLKRLTCGSSLGRGLWNHLLRCRFALLGKGGRIPQDFGPLADPRFIRAETIMSNVEHLYSIADSHAQTVQVCIDRLHELGANEQLKLLTGRLQNLAARATVGVDDQGTKPDQRQARRPQNLKGRAAKRVR